AGGRNPLFRQGGRQDHGSERISGASSLGQTDFGEDGVRETHLEGGRALPLSDRRATGRAAPDRSQGQCPIQCCHLSCLTEGVTDRPEQFRYWVRFPADGWSFRGFSANEGRLPQGLSLPPKFGPCSLVVMSVNPMASPDLHS